MARTRTPLSFRVRYEGRVQTIDRRPLSEVQAELHRSPVRYMVAHTLSRFRLKLQTSDTAMAVPRLQSTSRATPVLAAQDR